MEDGGEACNSMNGLERPESLEEQQEMPAENVESSGGDFQETDEMQASAMASTNNAEDTVAQDGSSKQYPCHPAPPVEIKMFVGRLPRTVTEDDVRPLFSKFGDVIEVVIIRDRNTSTHKGSAFVRMACMAEADAAIRELNGQKVVDTSLGPILVKYAAGEAEKLGMTPASGEAGLDQAKLFVGSLPKTATDEEVKQLFEKYGTVDEVYVMRDSSGVGKGCAFVKFAYKEQAYYAHKELDGKRTLEGLTRPMEVRFAESKGQKGEGGGGKARSQFGMGADPMGMGGYFQNPYGAAGGMGMQPSNNTPRTAGPWKEYIHTDGRPYYHNEVLNITQWDMPPEFAQLGQANKMRRSGSGESLSGPPGSNLFVFHVPNEWTDYNLMAAFAPFGEIVSASIARDKKGERTRGFGFVSYTNPRSAANAVSNMNGFMTFGKRLKVSVKQGEQEHAAPVPAAGAAGGGAAAAPNGGAMANYMNTVNNPGLGMPPVGMNNMMNQYAAMQGGGQYGYAVNNRYAPY